LNNLKTQSDGPAATTPKANAVTAVRSSELLGTARMLKIEHQGAIYVLRATSKGGLILTK